MQQKVFHPAQTEAPCLEPLYIILKVDLQHKKYDKETASYAAYSQGMLPNSQIVAMSARFAVKIFLSHLFTLWYEYDRGIPAPKPFVESQLGHVHIIPPPHREILFPD